MAAKKSVKKKASKKPSKAKASKKVKAKKPAPKTAKTRVKPRPAKKKTAKPKAKKAAPKAKTKGKPVKRAVVNKKPSLKPKPAKIVKPPVKKVPVVIKKEVKDVKPVKQQAPLAPPPVQKPLVKAPAKRTKQVVPTEPPEEVVPLQKVVKTFSLKEDKGSKKSPPHPNQFSIEYLVHASPSLLFEVISSPSGLSEWFADDVNIRDGNFTFFWDGSTQVAKQIAYKQDKLVRFQWEGRPDYTFFEFRIETDDLTNDTSLIITDFAEDGDKESARLLWDNQINRLRKAIGS